MTEVLEASSSSWIMARRLIRAKDAAVAIMVLVGFVASGVIMLTELRAKPSTDDVEQMLEEPDAAIEAQGKALADLKDDTASLASELDHVQRVQAYTVEHAQWQADVLSHVAERRSGKPPPKPASLRAAELDMVTR